jgi:hypothetical protein
LQKRLPTDVITVIDINKIIIAMRAAIRLPCL